MFVEPRIHVIVLLCYFSHQMELSGITEDNLTYSDQKENNESLCEFTFVDSSKQ